MAAAVEALVRGRLATSDVGIPLRVNAAAAALAERLTDSASRTVAHRRHASISAGVAADQFCSVAGGI